MKKSLIFLIALALLVSVGIFAATAENQTQPGSVWCERCRKNIPAEEWTEWTVTGGDLDAEGHYYLSDTYVSQESTVTIPALKFVCLDLRGNTWITENMTTLSISGDLSILDSVGGGRILTTGANGSAGAFAQVNLAGALNLFGGTVQFVPKDDVVISEGGLICVDSGTVNVDGGTVTGGIVSAASDKNSFGGNFYLSGTSRLNLVSGQITKGMVIAGNNKQGGNIYATGNSIVTVDGGFVEAGYAGSAGGNIFLASNAKLYVTGGEIRDGMSPVRGGNIAAISGGTVVVEISGGTITGGVAAGLLKTLTATDDTTTRGEYGGGNIYGRAPSGTLKVSGGTIDGDVLLDYMGTLTLSGSPKIYLGNSNGLRINNSNIKADVSGLTSGAMIYVDSNAVFTKAIDASKVEEVLSYFRGAVRTSVTATTSNTLQGTRGTQGYCPHCDQLVTWTAATKASADGQHIYLTKNYYSSTGNINNTLSAVLDLNGYTIYRDNWRILLSASGKTLSVLDSWGGGKLEGSGIHASNNTYGAVVYVASGATFELYSGTIRMSKSLADSTATSAAKYGGTVYAAGTAQVKIFGGQLTGGQVTATEGFGGNIAMNGESGKLIVNGGMIRSGNADGLSGGNIYSTGSVEINGGIIMGGTGKYGGNIYSKKDLKITDGIIVGGTTTSSGGNIYANKLTMSGGLAVNGVSTAGGGGNIRVGDATSTISGNAVILSGKADTNAGNVYCVQNMTLNIQGGLIAGGVADLGGNIRQNSGDCTLNISGGVIAMGNAADGGNVYINNGTCSVTGGVVTAGYAEAGGNFYFNNNVYGYFKDDGNVNTPVPVVSYGTAYDGRGGNIYFHAADNEPYILQLGNCDIHGGYTTRQGNDIYLAEYMTFEVLPEFAQETTVYFEDTFFSEDNLSLDNYYAYCNGVYSGTLWLEGDFDDNVAKIITTASDPTLVIGQAALVMKDGTAQWYGSNEAAMAAYSDQVAYIQPGSGTLALPSGEYVIDLAGADVVVTGDSTASFYCYDTVNVPPNNFWGTVTVNGPKLLNDFTYEVDGNIYLMLEEDYYDMYSFHRLDMEVVSASVRPDTAGFYYSCKYSCDTKIFELIESFGIAVSLKDMPGTDFATDSDTLYTQLSIGDLGSSETNEFNSVIIDNILKADADNGSRGISGIYGMPYMVLNDGTEGGEQQVVISNGVCYSLKDVLSLVDRNNYYANKPALESFYQKWESVMKNWNFTNIGVKPQDDNVLRILMGGNSFAYYYVEELYGLLMENLPEGVTEVEIYNFYYSGRSMYTHWLKWSTQADGDYQVFLTDKNGRRQLQPNGKWTLEDALAIANWDYLALQGVGRSDIGGYDQAETLDAKCADLAIYAEALFGRYYEMFPYTQFLWHRTWAQEVGRITSSGFEYTQEYNDRYDPGMQYVCDYMTEVFDQDKPYDLIQVNSGAAWTVARELDETRDLLPYGGLCAMLARNTYGDGRPGSGDGQHDGDIGGGQLLNAYMWYMTITGDGDLTDNNYKPDYEMSDDLWNMLKEAAMTVYNAEE